MTDSSARTDRTTWWEAALMIRGQTAVDQRNIQAVWVWSLIFAAGASAVLLAFKFFPQLTGPLAWLLVLIPVVLSIPLVNANLRFLREADEFMRKVQFEGIAMGFAAGLIFCLASYFLEKVGAPKLPILAAAIPLTTGWAVGSFLAAYRYR